MEQTILRNAWLSKFVFSVVGTILLGFALYPLQQSGWDKYPDFIAGNVAFGLRNKAGEIYFVLALSIFFFASLFGQSLIVGKSRVGQIYLSAVNWLAVRFEFLSKAVSWEIRSAQFFTKVSEHLLSLVLIYFASCAVLLLIPLTKIFLFTAVCLVIFYVISFLRGSRLVFYHLVQVPLPLLLLRFAYYDIKDGAELIRVGMNANARLFFYCLVFLLLAHSVYRLGRVFTGRVNESVQWHFSWLSQVSVFSIAAVLAWQVMPASPFLLDDYHTGEMMIPFQQIFIHGLDSFREFVSVHSYLAIVQGAINYWVYQDTYTSFALASVAMKGVLAGSAAILTGQVLRNPALGLFFGAWVLPQWERYYLLPILFLLLVHPRFSSGSAIHLATVGIAAILNFLFNPSSGMAFIIAILPWLLLQFWGASRKQAVIGFAAIAGFGILVSGEISGVLLFVRENGLGAFQGFGMTIFEGHEAPAFVQGLGNPFINDLVAALFKWLKLWGWLFAMGLIFIYLLQREWDPSPRLSERIRDLLQKWKLSPKWLWVITGILFFGAMIPYAYAWVGTRGLGRSGPLSIFAIAFLIPILWWRFERTRVSLFLAILLVTSLGLRFFSHIRDFRFPHKNMHREVRVPLGLEKYSAWKNIPNLGEAFVPPVYAKELDAFTALYRSSESFRKDGYVDLTNRQNFYYLFGVPVPSVYPAHIVAHNHLIQDRMWKQIQEIRPKYVRVARGEDHIYGSVPERVFRLLKEILFAEDWILIRNGNSGFLVEKSEWESHKDKLLATGWVESEAVAAKLAQIWPTRDLGDMPLNWGHSWKRIASELAAEISSGKIPTEQMSELRMPVPDYLRIELSEPVLGELHLRLRIQPNPMPDEFTQIEFKARRLGTDFLVPLRLDPRILMGKSLELKEVALLRTSSDSGQQDISENIKNLEFLNLTIKSASTKRSQ